MSLRSLTVDDAAAYHAFRLEGLRWYPDAFRSAYEDDVLKPIEWARRRIAASKDNPHGFVLGAFEDQAYHSLIGAIALDTTYARKIRHVAHVMGMLVAPAHVGKGIGAALLRALIDRAKTIDSLEQLHLTVTASNASAIALYERHGFTRDGLERRAMKVGDEYFDKLYMSRYLDP